MSVWFWVTLWAVLVTATVIGAILLGRWLWRTFRALMAELDRAEERHGPAMIRLDAALNAAEERTEPDGDPHRPSMFSDDLTTHYARVAALREARTARRAARRLRHERTWERWRHFNDPHGDGGR